MPRNARASVSRGSAITACVNRSTAWSGRPSRTACIPCWRADETGVSIGSPSIPCSSPRPLGVKNPFAVRALVSMSAEVVPLGLDQVGGRTLAAQHVEVAQRVAHGQAGDAVESRDANDTPPGVLALVDLGAELLVHQQVREIGPPSIGGADLIQQRGADDAAALPDARDAPQVQVVVI